MLNIESLASIGSKRKKSKPGKKFDAYIVLNDEMQSSFQFEKSKIKKK
jgi:DNA topoisomerase-3